MIIQLNEDETKEAVKQYIEKKFPDLVVGSTELEIFTDDQVPEDASYWFQSADVEVQDRETSPQE